MWLHTVLAAVAVGVNKPLRVRKALVEASETDARTVSTGHFVFAEVTETNIVASVVQRLLNHSADASEEVFAHDGILELVVGIVYQTFYGDSLA